MPQRCGSKPTGGVRRTKPAVTAPCATPHFVPHAGVRGGPHVTAGSKAGRACVKHGWRIQHSCASSVSHRVQAAAASRRHGALSTGRWRSPASWSARHACLRERDAFPRERTRPPVWMKTYQHACRHGHVGVFPSQAFVSSGRARHATRMPARHPCPIDKARACGMQAVIFQR